MLTFITQKFYLLPTGLHVTEIRMWRITFTTTHNTQQNQSQG